MLALLCPGQGSQNSSMFSLTGGAQDATDLFARAAVLLGGTDPRRMVQSESIESLRINRTAQILCVLQALSAAAVLRSSLSRSFVVAGYSVGELASWAIAGAVDPIATLELAARRAEFMDSETGPTDGLLFVRGLRRSHINVLCNVFRVDLAIVNPDDAVVLGGPAAALAEVAIAARARGATRVVAVHVGVASHTKRLAPAAARFRSCLDSTKVHFPLASGVRLLSGIDGAPVFQASVGLDKLAAQIAQTVDWNACLHACLEAGANAFLELGPGSSLTDMLRHAFPGVRSRSLDEFKSIDGVKAWVSGIS